MDTHDLVARLFDCEICGEETLTSGKYGLEGKFHVCGPCYDVVKTAAVNRKQVKFVKRGGPGRKKIWVLEIIVRQEGEDEV